MEKIEYTVFEDAEEKIEYTRKVETDERSGSSITIMRCHSRGLTHSLTVRSVIDCFWLAKRSIQK